MNLQDHEKQSMDELRTAARPAAVARALEIFSDFWSFAVLQEIFFGVRRFDEFQRNLNISRSVLTRRLRHLEQQQIVSRKLYSDRPKRFEYKLTERGRDMYPIFVMLRQWGEKWLEDTETPGVLLTHKPCGKDLKISMTCSTCGEEVNARDVDYRIER